MPNTIADLKNAGSWIAKEATRILTNNLVAISKANRVYESEFSGTANGYKKGETINVRRPAEYTVRSGATASVQDHTETYVPVTIDKQHGIDVSFTSREMTLNLSEFSERVIKPQVNKLANFLDNEFLKAVYPSVYNFVGTPGTTPNSYLSIGNAMRLLQEEAAPTDDIVTLLDPAANITMADALKGLFQKQTIDNSLLKGYLATLAGSDLYMTQSLPIHTVGPRGGTPLVNGANQTGSSLVTDGWTAAVGVRLNVGDVFTIANVFAVNPLTKQSTGQLRRFVVTASASSDVSGNATISISPAITLTGPFQTVNALPADNAAITVLTGNASTGYNQNLMFHKDAFTFVSAPMEMPGGMDMAGRETANGVSVRFVRGFDIVNDAFISRLDVLWGARAVQPNLAVRITG